MEVDRRVCNYRTDLIGEKGRHTMLDVFGALRKLIRVDSFGDSSYGGCHDTFTIESNMQLSQKRGKHMNTDGSTQVKCYFSIFLALPHAEFRRCRVELGKANFYLC